MRRMPLVITAMTATMAFTAGPAFADGSMSQFRLDGRHLEPGCFVVGGHGQWRYENRDVDVDSHLVFGKSYHDVSEDAHITVEDGAPFSIDQVLIAGVGDGYKVYNEFDTGTVNNDPDIDPGQTATGLTANTKFIDERATIVCVSQDHANGDNRPYGQEDHGYVHVKDSVILAPSVTAFGQSAVKGLKTYRIGFGYGVERWYAGYRKNQDAISIFPNADGSYNARGVNDVDKAGESWSSLFTVSDESDASDGQTFLFHKSGDMTAWADSSLAGYTLDNEHRYLLTDLTQGDLPMSWTLRPALAPSANKRTATMTLADFFAWNKSWQDFYAGKAGMPGTVSGTLPLAPGTNSPEISPTITVVNNVTVTAPLPTPSNPTPAPVVTVNPTPVTVSGPAAVTVGGVTPAGANAIAKATDDTCTSHRVIQFTWPRGDKKTHIRFRGHSVKGKMRNGHMRATADFRGYKANRGDLFKVAVLSKRHGQQIMVQRVCKAC
jgi:hypothetical protein